MGEFCERMRGDLKIAGFSPSTSKIYLMYARHFARFHMRDPAELGRDDVREFLLHLAERKVSPCTMRQVRVSLTLLCTTTLCRPVEVERLPLQRRMKRWPLALSGAEVGQMLGMIRKDSYRVMVMAMDSTELRSRESVHLRAEDLERVSEHRAEEPVRVLDIDFAMAVGPVLARVVRALAGVIDDVRRGGRDECCGLAVPSEVCVGDARAVAAEQAVVAEDPQVARLGDRDRWRGLGARVVVPYMHSVLAHGEVATDGPVPHAVSEPSSVRHSAWLGATQIDFPVSCHGSRRPRIPGARTNRAPFQRPGSSSRAKVPFHHVSEGLEMASPVVQIPGRRISHGETFYTDWMSRGGDCAILRAQALIKSSTTGSIYISLETRSLEDTSATSMDTYYPSTAPKLLKLDAVGVKTAIYLATTGSNSPARGLKEQVRCKVTFTSGSAGDYYVLRIFPLIYFDNSMPA